MPRPPQPSDGLLIAAYTGCRIGEALQLRKQGVFEESGHHVIKIDPEAGSVKTHEFRLVPIHRHLIELGWITFVDESVDRPLFAAGSYKRVLDFVREIVTDPRVQPNQEFSLIMAGATASRLLLAILALSRE